MNFHSLHFFFFLVMEIFSNWVTFHFISQKSIKTKSIEFFTLNPPPQKTKIQSNQSDTCTNDSQTTSLTTTVAPRICSSASSISAKISTSSNVASNQIGESKQQTQAAVCIIQLLSFIKQNQTISETKQKTVVIEFTQLFACI